MSDAVQQVQRGMCQRESGNAYIRYTTTGIHPLKKLVQGAGIRLRQNDASEEVVTFPDVKDPRVSV